MNCVDSGLVRTGIARGAGPIQRLFAAPLQWFAREPREAAHLIAVLALDPAFKATTGQYFAGSIERRPGRRGRDADAAARLWVRSCDWLHAEERNGPERLLRGA